MAGARNVVAPRRLAGPQPGLRLQRHHRRRPAAPDVRGELFRHVRVREDPGQDGLDRLSHRATDRSFTARDILAHVKRRSLGLRGGYRFSRTWALEGSLSRLDEDSQVWFGDLSAKVYFIHVSRLELYALWGLGQSGVSDGDGTERATLHAGLGAEIGLGEHAYLRPEDLELSEASDDLPRTLQGARDEAERRLLVESLTRNAGNITRASRDIKVSRPTFHDLLRKHGIEAARYRRPDSPDPDEGDGDDADPPGPIEA